MLVLDSQRPETHANAKAVGVPVILSDNRTPVVFADQMVADGKVTGCVAGAVYTSAEVLRAALKTIGVRHGLKTVSSSKRSGS